MNYKSDITQSREKEIYKVTAIGSIVNLLLLIFKFAAGILGQSAAMIADAVHSLSDFATDIIVILFVRISSKPKDRNHAYGHGKYETLATAIIGITLFAVGAGVLWSGISKIRGFVNGQELESPGTIALIAALLSIAAKEILYRYTVAKGKKLKSQSMEANAWHHRSDALSSIGTAIGIGGAILLGEPGRVLDPIAAVVVSIFIMKVALHLVIPCIEDLLEKSLPEETENEIKKALLAFSEVSQPHNLRTRRIGNSCSMEVHVRMDGNMTVAQSHEITREMESKIREILGNDAFISIHVEPLKQSETDLHTNK